MLVALEDVDLHYEVVGAGEPLLWLHGFMGSGADWKYIFAEPPAGYQLIAPDLRGHGRSISASGAFSFRQAALDVRGLLRHLGIATIKAIGVSGGGITLLHIATAEPASIASMVIVSAPPSFPAQARAIQRRASQDMFGDVELEAMRRRHAGGDRQLQQLLVHARALADDHDDVNFTVPYLSSITAETLIVFGDRDPLYPVTMAFDLYSAIPRSYLWVVPNGGHGPVFGAAAPRFADTALSFLRGDWSAT
jgi:pimeloyl-ACP methyl ester carboxylesterase